MKTLKKPKEALNKLLSVMVYETKSVRKLSILSIAFSRLWNHGSKTSVVLALVFCAVEACLNPYEVKLGQYLVDTIWQGATLGYDQPLKQPIPFLPFPNYRVAMYCLVILIPIFKNSIFGAYNAATGFGRNATYRSQVTFITKMFDRLLSLDLSYHVRNPKGMFTRIQIAIKDSQNFLYRSLLGNFLRILFSMVTFLAMIFMMDKKLFLHCAGWLGVSLYTNTVFGSFVDKVEKECWKHVSDANDRSQDVINNIEEVKMCGREADEIKRRQEDADRQLGPLLKGSLLWRILTTIQELWQGLGYAVAMIFIVLPGVFSGRFTAGQVIMFHICWQMLFDGYMQWLFTFLDSYKLVYELGDVKALMNEKSKLVDAPGAEDFSGSLFPLEFRNVSFTYPDSNGIGVHNASFRIPKGKITVLAGRTGCGKSTALRLLVRLLDPDSGEILVGGKNIKRYKHRQYREKFVMLSQEGALFARSVAENIAYSCPQASREEIIEAAKIAQAHDFIMRMPNGYDELVCEKGGNLSGGQRRRLALARILLKGRSAEVFVFDEPTTGLDAITAGELLEEVVQVSPGKTLVMIAHDRNIIAMADQIIFMEDGRVMHVGPPEEVAEVCKDFRRLAFAN